MQYRAEIDGLRAVSVLPVLLFHAGFQLFSGGFVGVDIFFVISGYLISSIIIEDIQNKCFSLVNFYERRARRILPALFLVMIVCIPFSWVWMLPNQMKDFSQSLVAISFFASNIQFWRESGYFEPAVELVPLLHTWSLSVEDQFYLVFPIFLILIWRFGWQKVFWIIVIFGTASLILSEFGWRYQASANFYLAPTRAWELFAGVLTAFFIKEKGVQRSNFLALMGLAAIICSLFVYDENTPFPSFFAALPVSGACLIILFAARDTLVARMLSHKYLVGLGLISYSTYLWHQPLFAFFRIRFQGQPSEFLMLSLSVFSIFLAFFSWKYVERPFRDKNRFGRTKILFFSAIGLLSFASFGLLGHAENGFQKRIQGWKELKEIPTVNVNYCHNKGRKTSSEMERGEYCFVGNGDLKVSIIGDSHAAALFDAAHDYLATIDKSAIAVSGGFCAPLLNGFEAGEDCKEAIHIALNHAIASEEIETIVLAAEWANYSTGYREDNPPKMWRDDQGIAKNSSENAEIFKRSFSLTFDTLSKSGKNIIIVYPVPEFKQHSYNWIGKQVLFNDIPNVNAAASTLPTISMLDYKKRNKERICYQ